MALHQQGGIERAAAMYREALEINPQESNAWHLLGVAAWQCGDLNAAEADIRKAIGFHGEAPAYHCNLGGVLKQKGEFAKAIETYREALSLLPDYADAKRGLAESYGRYGHALAAGFEWERAKAAYRALLEINPKDSGALNNLAQILHNSGHEDEALPLYDRAIELKPENGLAHFNRGICRLGESRLTEGWRDIAESTADWLPLMDKRKNLPWAHMPLWDGGNLRGKKILVWGDQGIGDEIIYASMIPELVAQGAIVTVECAPRLVPLFARSFPAIAVLPREAKPLAQGGFDYHAPGLWLARWLRKDFGQFSARSSYLAADKEKTKTLRDRYAALGKAKIIGVAWTSKTAGYGVHRRVNLAELVAALPRKGVLYIDLQYGDTTEERAAAQEKSPDFTLHHDPTIDQMQDMDGFAAQIAACDGVITIGNTAAHLTGALGIPGAVFAPYAGRTWYWFKRGEECPWYPSLALLWPDTPDRFTRSVALLKEKAASR